MKKDLDDDDNDEIYSRKKVHGDVIKLYSGPDFNGAKAYSRMMSTIFVILLFSSGMPILYFIGAIWFIVTYLSYKVFILKFFKRTITMNRIIPQYSVTFLKACLVVHMIGASFIMTNPEPFDVNSESDSPLIKFNAIKDLPNLQKYYKEHKDDKFVGLLLNRFKYTHQ